MVKKFNFFLISSNFECIMNSFINENQRNDLSPLKKLNLYNFSEFSLLK